MPSLTTSAPEDLLRMLTMHSRKFRRVESRNAKPRKIGLLFYELEIKKPYYPTRKDEEARNPDGSNLR